MGECGCIGIQYRFKIIDEHGDAWCFGVYPSCHYCDSPVGIQVLRVKAGSEYWDMWDIDDIPSLTVEDHSDMAFMTVVDTQKCRKAMETAIIGYKPESGIIDEADADVLSDEAFRDLRDVVAVEVFPEPKP